MFKFCAASSRASCVYPINICRPAIELSINLVQQTLLLQVVGDDLDGLLNAGLLAVDVDLCVLGSLVGSADASELLDLARAGLLVQTLGVALLSLLDGNVNEDLDEGERRLVGLGVVVEVTGDLAVGLVGGDERGKSDGGAVGEELGDLSYVSEQIFSTLCNFPSCKLLTHLSDTPNVLLSVLGREAEVLVQAEPDVVAIESVGLETTLEEVLLESNGDGGLARGRETSEPDGGALLLAEVGALSAGKTCVPCDVAAAFVRICECVGRCRGRWRGRGGAD